ncbi:intracellular protein transport protein USO1-like isoform X2 [Durio zibethinus]|uniref:Intracellular protein transport protein USO1-like isoform X2 n=1 Tax=Durio zibethinus TaxID=66656 RepID=A0A6P5Z258_DURZI|nr:intracellular protein transport protein USO1-like isoform X2 [Durio zibethinus]
MMPRQNLGNIDMENLLPGKIRKRGCSSSASSSSSIIQNYRFKRAILVGSKRGGSTTPVPTWKLMMRSPSTASMLRAAESPRNAGSQSRSKLKGQGQGQQQQPVSARKLAATLWEMNEIPSPRIKEGGEESRRRKERRERGAARSVHSGSLPRHLSDPSHSPVSEIETRSHAQTPMGSTVGVKTRLKDVSNALTTSKELLKIINRMWGHEDRPSSSMSLISALHAELERARLLVNQLIQEQRSDRYDINYLMKCFAEEKAAWKNKEQKVVEAAIESIAVELEVERKLRRRFESLNKKLGKELAETKTSLLKSVKELESEKRTRVVIEQVCDELARDISEDKAEKEELKRESAKVREEIEKEREMMQLADVLCEQRVQMKRSEAKYHLEEKNTAVDKMRNQLENFLGTKRVKETGRGSLNEPISEEISAYLNRAHFCSHPSEENEQDGEVEDVVVCEEDSAESDLHSIELNMDNNNKSYKWAYAPDAACDSRDPLINEEDITGRKSTSSRLPRRSSLQRSISDGVDWGMPNGRLQNSGDDLEWGRFAQLEKQVEAKSYGDEVHGYKAVKGLREHLLSGSRAGRVYASSTRSSRDLGNVAQERPPLVPGSVLKSRLAESRGEANNARKSRW